MNSNNTALSDQELIEAIRLGGRVREDCWRFIVANWGDYCCNTIVHLLGCDRAVAAEGLSIAVVGVDRRIRSSEGLHFLRSASLKTYLTASAIHATQKNIQKKTAPHDRIQEQDLPDAYVDMSDWFDASGCREAMEKSLEGLNVVGKQILLLFNDGYSMSEIAKEMGFANEASARKEKYKYQEKYKKYLLENPSILNLLKENCYG